MANTKIRREDLLRIIDLCQVVETRGSDPFGVDVKRSLTVLKRHLPDWKILDELILDANALAQITSIIRLQKKWIAYRASSLYVDPLVIELKIRLSQPEDLAKSLSKSWHPIVSLQQLFPERISAAMDYWNTLLPLNERFVTLSPGEPIQPGSFDFKDLVRMKAISEEQFRDMLDSLLLELKVKIGANEKIRYADFIYVADYQETILRAYLTSFLVSEGAVVLQTNPLEEEHHLTLSNLDKSSYSTSYNSKVITINHESWKKHLKGDSTE